VRAVGVHRRGTDAQHVRDFFVAVALGDQLKISRSRSDSES
jgi:hypothetical protein